MIIGVPKERKRDEYRVALTPAGAEVLSASGHTVLIEKGAGLGSGIRDEEYQQVGARTGLGAAEVWKRAELILKVKEPLPDEYKFFSQGKILFAYLHLAASKSRTRALIRSGMSGIAYETVRLENGRLPLLEPMSEIAGRMAVQVGAKYLQREEGGRGQLLGGATGVEKGKVVIIGGGIVGKYAAEIAIGMGAEVTVLDIDLVRLKHLDDVFRGQVSTLASNTYNIRRVVPEADLLIGAVLIPGARTPRLVSRELVRRMKDGSVIVDVAVDQGGCVETARPTYHSRPTFVAEGVVHYCVANMPGAVAHTSTYALTNATLPYVRKLADMGLEEAVRGDDALALGLNLYQGQLTNPAVAEAHGLRYKRLDELL